MTDTSETPAPLSARPDPLAQFSDWYDEACETEINDPNAMTLATVSADGLPSLRVVLLKGFDGRGFAFYTNFESRKGRDLLATARAALNFHWKSRRRQVRVEGDVAPVDDDEADAYFASRPRGSQIGAWASIQSAPLPGRAAFEDRIAAFTERFAGGAVPRPPHWSGFRLAHRRIEFWQEMPFRLHDRLVYVETPDGWRTEKLYP
ncbi:MAG: pyridoxamine 5'-phosphate oxidase [Azospirillaceae bacterium]